jgi:predicted O-linked N-acetylglucosamine transferase (SPINDLY family)
MSSYFKEHDRTQFEVYAFSLIVATTHEALDRQKILKPQVFVQFLGVFWFAVLLIGSRISLLTSQFDHWIEAEGLSDYALATKIHEHGIDVAIDLCGLADLPQLAAYSYHPAPVQISFLGYPGMML